MLRVLATLNHYWGLLFAAALLTLAAAGPVHGQEAPPPPSGVLQILGFYEAGGQRYRIELSIPALGDQVVATCEAIAGDEAALAPFHGWLLQGLAAFYGTTEPRGVLTYRCQSRRWTDSGAIDLSIPLAPPPPPGG